MTFCCTARFVCEVFFYSLPNKNVKTLKRNKKKVNLFSWLGCFCYAAPRFGVIRLDWFGVIRGVIRFCWFVFAFLGGKERARAAAPGCTRLRLGVCVPARMCVRVCVTRVCVRPCACARGGVVKMWHLMGGCDVYASLLRKINTVAKTPQKQRLFTRRLKSHQYLKAMFSVV